eukprot:CAMPEP_0198205532 /NCGR_PEP_ID=MMETSP1445-20131203/9072_1 /TAXON_ID=36898 /ORGANISM="Pyramimonas sp., Strain CCMP2087" /LENGTH=460 /DNA_ID=CAMNT_0043877873 /DNA_START=131 /DNA_END=1513 /DNA_ORIENTATION=-
MNTRFLTSKPNTKNQTAENTGKGIINRASVAACSSNKATQAASCFAQAHLRTLSSRGPTLTSPRAVSSSGRKTPSCSRKSPSWGGNSPSSSGKSPSARRNYVVTSVMTDKKDKRKDKQDKIEQDDYMECEVRMGKLERVKPGSLAALMRSNYDLEFGGIVDWGKDNVARLKRKVTGERNTVSSLPDCLGLVLNDEMVRAKDTDHKRDPDEPLVIRLLYDASVAGLDLIYGGRPIQRFWTLEVIARIPYFSYVSVLHLYESLGWWQNSELSKVHFSQAYAEQHHLLIMESLGGNSSWFDRFIAQHTALVYYWAVVVSYLVSPKWSYYFMQLVEQHAYDTYAVFVENNREELAMLPAPTVAEKFYRDGDLYLFDEFHVVRSPSSGDYPRRPPVDNLLQVFENVRDDENEHIKTLIACQDYEWLEEMQISPHSRMAEMNKDERTQWKEWSAKVTAAGDPVDKN